MGNSSNKGALETFYGGYTGAAGINGGDESPVSMLGGAPDYASSPMSSAKKQLIKDLATVLGDRLKIPNLQNLAKKDTASIVEALRKHIPNPSAGGNGMRFGSDKDVQVRACNILVKAINERMGGIIDENAPTSEKCRHVAEVMYSLFSGLTDELVVARKDIENAMKNLNTLHEFMDRQYNLLETQIKAEKDSSVAAKTAAVREVHGVIKQEHDRQMQLLQNMLDTIIKPSETDLKDLLSEAKQFKRLVKRIRKYPGTTDFGRKIAYTLGELGLVASAAKTVDKALKELGISYKEYAKTDQIKDLKKLLNKDNIKKLNLDEAALERYEKAKDILIKHHYMHDDVIKQLEKEAGGKSKTGGDLEIDFDAFTGGAVTGGLKIDKRVKTRKNLKAALIRDFETRMAALTRELLVSAKHIAKTLGNGKIELGDKLREFIKALELVPDLHQKHTYFSLTGVIDDINSRQERERFQSIARQVISAIDGLMSSAGSAAPYLKDMRASFVAINELIDAYVRKFTEGFGPIEPWETYVKGRDSDSKLGSGIASVASTGARMLKSAAKGFSKNAPKVMTATAELSSQAADTKESISRDIKRSTDSTRDDSAESSVDDDLGESSVGGDDLGIDLAALGGNAGVDFVDVVDGGAGPGMTRTANDLKEVIDTLTYFHRIALMRHSMVNSSKEHAAYKEDYIKVLADAIADGRDGVTRERNDWMKTHRKNEEHLDIQYTDTTPAITTTTTPIPQFTVGENIIKQGDEFYDYLDFMYKGFGKKIPDFKTDELARKKRAKLNSKYDEVLKFGKALFEAKDNMFRVAEAMDIYMKEFTDGISSNPDDIQNIMAMLNNTETISSWFSNTSGDLVARVYDSFPSGSSSKREYSDLNVFSGEGHYYVRVAAIGDLTPAGKQADAIAKIKALGTAKSFADYVKNGGAKTSAASALPGNPFSSNPIINPEKLDDDNYMRNHSAVRALEDARKASGFGALKNLIAAFATIGDRFGGSDLLKRTHMSSKLFLKHLNDYIACSTFKFSRDANNVEMRDLRNADADMFSSTDNLFKYVIKAIVAKILTVIGTYNMLNKPINKAGLGYRSDLRLILGGYDGGAEDPKVIPEAIELYVRLPLLAEFYRKIFDFDNDASTISMIPEMTGTFGGLIAIIFDKAKSVEDGNYSDSEIRSMIEQINKIFARFRANKNPVQDTINEFIHEVNRRYGVIKAEERDSYKQERADRYASKYDKPEDYPQDYEIAGIDEDDDYRRPAPSDAFLGQGTSLGTASGSHKYKIEAEHKNMLDTLRKNISDLFNNAEDNMRLGNDEDDQGRLKNISFNNMIRTRRTELTHAKTERERYEIIRQAISSLGGFATTSLEKAYIMFHETVVTGLNTLHAVYQLLAQFKSEVILLSAPVINLNKLVGYNSDTDTYKPDDISTTDLSDIAGLITTAGGIDRLQGSSAAVTDVALNAWLANAINTPVWDALTSKQKELVKQVAHRFAINQNLKFESLFELLYNHASNLNDLVDLKIDHITIDSKVDGTTLTYNDRQMLVHVDHSKLREKIYSLFNSIKNNFEKFRGLLPANVIDRYEKFYKSRNDENEGSIYWLEKKLVDELIDGKYADVNQQGKGLDSVNKIIGTLIKYFTKKWNISGETVTQYPGGVINASDIDEFYAGQKLKLNSDPDKLFTYHNFAKTLKKLTNSLDGLTTTNLAQLPVNVAGLGTDDSLRLLYNTSGKRKGSTEPNHPFVPLGTMGLRLPAEFIPRQSESWYSSFDAGTAHRGLVLSFNRLLISYINIIYDEPSRSVYLPALNKFANGAFSVAVNGQNVWKENQINDCVNFNSTGKGQGSIILETLAMAMKQLVSEKTVAGSDLEFAKADLSEIPMYVVERMKANLPVFKKLFHLLMSRSEIAKKFAQTFNIGRSVDMSVAIMAGLNSAALTYPAGTVAPAIKPGEIDEAASDKQATSEIVNTLDQVSRGCHSLIQCINDTINDLADSPKFLETYDNFINDYEGMNGNKPFMPVSSALYYLGDQCTADNNHHVPVWNLGSTPAKMLYGTRGLLNKESISIEDVPGIKSLADDHNATSDPKHHFDIKRLSSYTQDLVQLLQYSIDTRRYKTMLGKVTVPDLFNNKQNNLLAYQIDKNYKPNLSDVIRITESNSQREQRNRLLNQVESSLSEEVIIRGQRQHLIAYNIIDMNVVPINVHALMREVPLVNLYNYSYTFDHLVGQLVPHSPESGHSAEELFAKLLKDPYVETSNKDWRFHLPRIMRGALGIPGLGRPKYLGDEIWNKVLFQELLSDQTYDDESGPSGSDRVEYGRRHDADANVELLLKKLNDIIAVGGTTTAVDITYKELIAGGKLYSGTVDWVKLETDLDALGYTGAKTKADLTKVLTKFRKEIMDRPADLVPERVGSNDLHWLEAGDYKKNKGKAELKQIGVDGQKGNLDYIGKNRFNTPLIRNLMWITQIQRVLRLKLRRDLTWYNQKVVSDHATIAPGLTELYDHDLHKTPNMYNYQY